MLRREEDGQQSFSHKKRLVGQDKDMQNVQAAEKWIFFGGRIFMGKPMVHCSPVGESFFGSGFFPPRFFSSNEMFPIPSSFPHP